MNTKCGFCGYPNPEDATVCAMCRHKTKKDMSGKHTPAPIVQVAVPVTAFTSDPRTAVGKAVVRVMRRSVDDHTGKEKVDQIHEGIVVENIGNNVRVFNPKPQDKGGDVSPEAAELFPLDSKLLWCELVSERKTAFPIPVGLRH